MAARFKGYRKFKDERELDTGITFETYINSRNGEFIVAWGNHTFQGKVYTELVQKMQAHIREENQLTFKPIIVVKEKAPFASRVPFVAFTFERLYVSKRSNGRIARIEWHEYTGQGDLQIYKFRIHPPGDFRYDIDGLPAVYGNDESKTYVLEYTEPLWEGLNTLYDLVETMQRQFRTLLGTAEGQARIAQVGGSAMLPANALGVNDDQENTR